MVTKEGVRVHAPTYTKGKEAELNHRPSVFFWKQPPTEQNFLVGPTGRPVKFSSLSVVR
jgi:hypothetical protein